MRYLNKIIFLNSAHVPYAEVKLDGNVHFIGTQGVGKSTLLRAVLFFYNADKLRLGIPKEKKNFDSFYLPFAISYIVYEVMRENGAYTIACNQRRHICTRFRHSCTNHTPIGRDLVFAVNKPLLTIWSINKAG